LDKENYQQVNTVIGLLNTNNRTLTLVNGFLYYHWARRLLIIKLKKEICL
jgi:hypothetical protein